MKPYKNRNRILFVLKKRNHGYGSENGDSTQCFSSGLFNSANMVNNMLNANAITSKIVEVVDNNDIDREVHSFRPTHVIIEALWVVPEKFHILAKLHPRVNWIVRIHSETGFIANEGVAMDWILNYISHKNVVIGVNSRYMFDDLTWLIKAKKGARVAKEKVVLLPNYYEIGESYRYFDAPDRAPNTLDIGCFGAIRPMKNQLTQAVAAVRYAQNVGQNLRFHINASRVENKGNNCLKNIRALFDNLPSRYQLIEHGWLPHNQFLRLVAKMDLGMQVSYTETFNIVAADCVSQGIPVVVSDEIEWVSSVYHADPNSTDDIVRKMRIALFLHRYGWSYFNLRNLKAYNRSAVSQWLGFLKD